MGKTLGQSDLPGHAFRGVMDRIASVASNGGASQFFIMRAPADINVTAAYWVPSGTDQTANTASYRRLSIVNGGTDGLGTTIVASLNITASQASKSMNAFVGSGSVPAGGVVLFSQVTVGGDEDDATELVAGYAQVEYELR